MKTYVVSLKRAAERREYITKHVSDLKLDYKIMEAVDGSLLTEDDLKANCDMDEVNKYRAWLSNSMIGCALSHYNVYEEFLKTNEKACLIIEDDASLPDNINEILSEIEGKVEGAEVVMLYYFPGKPCKLSSVGAQKIMDSKIMFPLTVDLVTTAAYIISREAAQRMHDKIKPIRVGPDSWNNFYELGCFDSFKAVYPLVVKTKHFKSSINYFEGNRIGGFISSFINTYKLPIIYDLVKYMRMRRFKKIFSNISLTDEVSPIYEKVMKIKQLKHSDTYQ